MFEWKQELANESVKEIGCFLFLREEIGCFYKLPFCHYSLGRKETAESNKEFGFTLWKQALLTITI